MKNNNLERTASFGRLLLLFAAIMLFFLAITADQTLEKILVEEEKQYNLNLASSQDRIFAATQLETFIKDRFMELAEVARQPQPQVSQIKNHLENFQKDHTSIKCFFYNDQNLEFSFNQSDEDLLFFTSLMQRLHQNGEAFKKSQREIHQELLNRFGPGNRLELLHNHRGKIMRFKHMQKDQFYYWNSYENNRAIFLIATDFPDFIDRFSLAKIALKQQYSGAGDPKNRRFVAPQNTEIEQMQAAKIKSELTGKSIVSEFSRKWFFIEDESGNYTCLAVAADNPGSTFRFVVWSIKHFSFFFSIILIAIYCLSIFSMNPGRTICKKLDAASIKYRILGLFSMASIFPVLFSILIGATSLSDRAEIIENQATGESIVNLNRLETMISEKIEQSERMARMMRNKIVRQPASEEFFREHLKMFSLPRNLSRLEVRDGLGKELFSTDDRQVHGVSEAMDIFSRIALKQHAPSRLGQKANMVTPAEVVSESVLSTDELGMATILRQRGRQWFFRMGTFPTLWYYDVFPELATGPAFMHYSTQLITVFNKQVRETLAIEKQSTDNLQLSTELNYYYNNHRIFPAISGLEENRLLDAALVSMKTGKVVFRNTMLNQTPYWVAIKPEKIIGGHVFFNMISKPGRLAELTPLRNQLFTAGIMALAISMLGAMLLIRLFILPVGDISQGINAIRERQNDFKIEVRRKDEFGALASAFNKVIDELKELEYGKIVQSSLLPGKIPVPSGYDLACFRTSATDLAGDYHDILPLSDGRTAIILGDVTGHGISAALAMAMAKATVDYLDLQGQEFPGPLMDKLNALFNRELKPRHKFMTLVTMVLDPLSGELVVDNAGQSYPYYFMAAENKAEEIQIPSMPLGASKKRRAKPEVRTMKSGDAVILYSDGIIECSDTNEVMFGYDRFKETFIELLRHNLSAEQILATMINRLDNFRKPGPYPDDVTLVLLKKL